jgi:hypothetical protein
MPRKQMNRLYSAVSDAFRNAGSEDEWDIEPDGQYACLARNPRLEVRFTLDPRNDQVSSGMIFPDDPRGNKEQLYGYIVGRIFGNDQWKDPKLTDSIEEKSSMEVRNVLGFLSNMEEKGFTGRDIYLYYLGFNSGYSYRVAEQQRWDSGQF